MERDNPEAGRGHPEAPSEEYSRDIEYGMYTEGIEKNRVNLGTLLDTGNPVSFIKLKYVPSHCIDSADDVQNKFTKINSTVESLYKIP